VQNGASETPRAGRVSRQSSNHNQHKMFLGDESEGIGALGSGVCPLPLPAGHKVAAPSYLQDAESAQAKVVDGKRKRESPGADQFSAGGENRAGRHHRQSTVESAARLSRPVPPEGDANPVGKVPRSGLKKMIRNGFRRR
jgi:hypothetical protein